MVKRIIQIVALVREVVDEAEIAEMKQLIGLGVTAVCFYHIRDAHYDEGFTSGELVLVDADTKEVLVDRLVNLSKSIIKVVE